MKRVVLSLMSLAILSSCSIKISSIPERDQSDGYWKVTKITTIDDAGFPVDVDLKSQYAMPGEIYLDSLNRIASTCFVPRFGAIQWSERSYVKTNSVRAQSDVLTVNGEDYIYSYSGRKYTLTAVRDWDKTNAQRANDMGCHFLLYSNY